MIKLTISALAAAGPIAAPITEEREFPSLGGADKDDYPSLGAAATVKEAKKKDKRPKKQTMSLADFVNTDSDPIASLPTAPRGRAAGEEGPRERPLGGGFARDGYSSRFNNRDDSRRERRERDPEDSMMGPSRADTAGDWGAERKYVPSEPRRGMGGGGFEEGGKRDFGPSRADTAGDWGATRSTLSSQGHPMEERRSFREPSRADVEDRWERNNNDLKPTGFDDRPRREFEDRPSRGASGGFGDSWRGRRAPSAGGDDDDSSTWRRAGVSSEDREEPPAERPKLKLAPRTAPIESVAGVASSEKPSVFGTARPREEILREQGRDPVSEELQLEKRRAEKVESEEETKLKAQIETLKARRDAGEGDAPAHGKENEDDSPGLTVAQALEDAQKSLEKLQLDASSNGDMPGRPKSDREGSWKRSPDGGSKRGQKEAGRGLRDSRRDSRRSVPQKTTSGGGGGGW